MVRHARTKGQFHVEADKFFFLQKLQLQTLCKPCWYKIKADTSEHNSRCHCVSVTQDKTEKYEGDFLLWHITPLKIC